MQVRLILLTGSRVGEDVRVDTEATLGRSADCTLRLEDNGVSRRHARVRVDGDDVWLEDLGSSNGTKFGGQKVKSVRVSDGDVFELAKVKVRVKLAVDAPAAPPPPAAPPSSGGFEELEVEDARPAAPPAAAEIEKPAPQGAPQGDPFELEMPPVEVRGAAPPSSPAPDVQSRPQASQAMGGELGSVEVVAKSSARIEPRVAADRRAGVLGEDLSQQAGLQKLVVIVLVVAAAAGVFWLVFSSMR